jgi:hypothetical protein
VHCCHFLASHSLVASTNEVAMAKKTSCEFLARTCISEPLKSEIELAAEEEGRTSSDVIRRVLVDWASRRVMARERAEAA